MLNIFELAVFGAVFLVQRYTSSAEISEKGGKLEIWKRKMKYLLWSKQRCFGKGMSFSLTGECEIWLRELLFWVCNMEILEIWKGAEEEKIVSNEYEFFMRLQWYIYRFNCWKERLELERSRRNSPWNLKKFLSLPCQLLFGRYKIWDLWWDLGREERLKG